jgi:hypothetical protein
VAGKTFSEAIETATDEWYVVGEQIDSQEYEKPALNNRQESTDHAQDETEHAQCDSNDFLQERFCCHMVSCWATWQIRPVTLIQTVCGDPRAWSSFFGVKPARMCFSLLFSPQPALYGPD